MGYEAEDALSTYRLKFEDYPGLEVTAREPSVGQLLEITSLAGQDPKRIDPEKVKATFQLFADLLESWNVERKGKPVPATYEGVASLGATLVMKLITAVGNAVGTVDPTSQAASKTGPNYLPETSIPMTPANQSSS